MSIVNAMGLLYTYYENYEREVYFLYPQISIVMFLPNLHCLSMKSIHHLSINYYISNCLHMFMQMLQHQCYSVCIFIHIAYISFSELIIFWANGLQY